MITAITIKAKTIPFWLKVNGNELRTHTGNCYQVKCFRRRSIVYFGSISIGLI